MKIAFIVGSLAGGGAERVVSILASRMAQQGHDVSVLLIASNNQTYTPDSKVQVVDCSQKFNIRGLGFLQRVALIRKKLKAIKPEVCVSFTVAVNLYAVLACIGLKSQLVLAERNDPRFDPVGKGSRLLRTLLYPMADRYVFQTEGEKVYFSNRIQKRSAVIPNPVNPDIPQAYDGQREKRIVTAVRLDPQKNLKMAIDAFAALSEKYPEHVFEIYGKGGLRQQLQDYIVSLGLQNRVLLKGNSPTLYQDILKSQLFVLPSNYEGMSNSLLEAMALGLPCISTDHPSGGASAVIRQGENGLLIPVGGTEELTQAMDQLLSDGGLARRMGLAAQQVRQTLQVDRVIKMWMDYLLGEGKYEKL